MGSGIVENVAAKGLEAVAYDISDSREKEAARALPKTWRNRLPRAD